MQREKNQEESEIISIEEYLHKRQKMRELAGNHMIQKEKNPLFILHNFLYSE